MSDSLHGQDSNNHDVHRYDLHCHSLQSDGILSPEALVSRAKINGVTTLALTDHDTINGIEAARAQAAIEGIELINGVEFSCLWHGRSIHVVGLNFVEQNKSLQVLLDKQSERRDIRSDIIGEKLDKLGFTGILAHAKRIANGATLGRPHFAKAMIEQGKVKDVAHAFKHYLGAGKAGDVKLQWPEFDEVVSAIVSAGGQAVLAHPLKYSMTRTKLCNMLEDFVDSGGTAMEVVSGKQTMEQSQDMARVANKFELLASCGSDFHAPSSYAAELGQCWSLPAAVEPVWRSWS